MADDLEVTKRMTDIDVGKKVEELEKLATIVSENISGDWNDFWYASGQRITAYLSALSPDVCLVLCAELKKAREENERLVIDLQKANGECDEHYAALASTEKLVDELVEGLEEAFVILEALRISVKWELAPEIKNDIARVARLATALISRVKGGVK